MFKIWHTSIIAMKISRQNSKFYLRWCVCLLRQTSSEITVKDYIDLRSDLHCKVKEIILIRDLKPAINVNIGSENLFLYQFDYHYLANIYQCMLFNSILKNEQEILSEKLMNMLRVGIEPTSPCILIRSATHYTIRDHHTGNVAVGIVKLVNTWGFLGPISLKRKCGLHTNGVCFDFDTRLRSTE